MSNNITEETKNIFFILAIIVVFIWLLYYFIPSLFVSLFKTFLGNIILFIIFIFVSINNYKCGILLFILFIFVSRIMYFSSINTNTNTNTFKEGFTWDNKTTNDFLKVQDTINRNKIFVMEDIQKQASQKEAEYLIKNNKWPWSNETEQLYKASMLNNPFIQTYNKDSIIDAKRTYNENAILNILADQTKEGRFLTTGVEVYTGKSMVPNGVGDFGYTSGLITNMYNPVIKCHPKNPNYPNSSDYVLKIEEYIGDDGITGEHIIVTKDVDINNLENIIPGFTFLDKPCNPCSALDFNKNNKNI